MTKAARYLRLSSFSRKAHHFPRSSSRAFISKSRPDCDRKAKDGKIWLHIKVKASDTSASISNCCMASSLTCWQWKKKYKTQDRCHTKPLKPVFVTKTWSMIFLTEGVLCTCYFLHDYTHVQKIPFLAAKTTFIFGLLFFISQSHSQKVLYFSSANHNLLK